VQRVLGIGTLKLFVQSFLWFISFIEIKLAFGVQYKIVVFTYLSSGLSHEDHCSGLDLGHEGHLHGFGLAYHWPWPSKFWPRTCCLADGRDCSAFCPFSCV